MEENLFCSPKRVDVSDFCFEGAIILTLESS